MTAIGTGDEGTGIQLFQVADATRLSDGRIVVANGGSSELLFFDASGALVEALGRSGQVRASSGA